MTADRRDQLAEGFSTRAVHGARVDAVTQQPASVPIYQTSTWGFDSGEEFADVLAGTKAGYAYGRGYGNPTVEAFETVLASLEQTEACFAFSSGMSAIHAVCLSQAAAGDRIVASKELYGGTYSLFASVLPRYGVEVVFVDPHDVEAVEQALPGASLFYCETIANPLCTVADLASLGEACARAGVPAAVDNTFASPLLCNPGDYGFRFVIHSVTKMIAGHSDVVAGAVCCSRRDRDAVRTVALDTGGAMPPFDAWLCLRGVETLELRMERMCANAEALVGLLLTRDEVSAVHYPGLERHRDHATASKQFGGRFGSMLSFEMAQGAGAAARWCSRLEVAWIGASLGGTHSLACHPASTTHRQVPPELRRAAGLSDGLIRVSPGIENTVDLIGDFLQAFQRTAERPRA